MPYTYNPAYNPLAVEEQAYSTAVELRFTAFTSCIGLLAACANDNVGQVTGVHLVMVGADESVFDNAAADNAVALLGQYSQVVVIGLTDLWQANLPGPYRYLLAQLTHPIVMPEQDGLYGGRIEAGVFQVYINGAYVNVAAA